MVAENPTWGAPRIHGELLKLGFELSERSVSRWIRRAPRDPDPVKRWLMTKKQYRTPNVSVGTVKKSVAAMALAMVSEERCFLAAAGVGRYALCRP